MLINFIYYRKIEPMTHTQPSIVRIDDSSSSNESEDSVLIKSEIPPSPIDNNNPVNNFIIVMNIIF
jgi:hypothetical protein